MRMVEAQHPLASLPNRARVPIWNRRKKSESVCMDRILVQPRIETYPFAETLADWATGDP